MYVNRFELTYGRTYTASSDLLRFDGDEAGSWQFYLTGFTTDTVKILDVTDPTYPVSILGAQVQHIGPTYNFAVEQVITGEHHYVALTPYQIKSPNSVVRDATSNLHDSNQQADYIVITPQEFYTSAQTLANYRATHGLNTKVVDVQDVYDEFAYGITDAEAIRTFLQFAYLNWTRPAPSYVVLLGDGNFDQGTRVGRPAQLHSTLSGGCRSLDKTDCRRQPIRLHKWQ